MESLAIRRASVLALAYSSGRQADGRSPRVLDLRKPARRTAKRTAAA